MSRESVTPPGAPSGEEPQALGWSVRVILEWELPSGVPLHLPVDEACLHGLLSPCKLTGDC